MLPYPVLSLKKLERALDLYIKAEPKHGFGLCRWLTYSDMVLPHDGYGMVANCVEHFNLGRYFKYGDYVCQRPGPTPERIAFARVLLANLRAELRK